MGKGQIISGGTGGLYNVKLIYAYRARVEKKIADAQAQITALQTRESALTAQINAETDPKKQDLLILERSAVKLEITSREKLIGYYQDGMPADPTVPAYCMDLTEDLTGYVGTAEIPGEKVTVVIRPGYDGRATYLASRDGQLMPPIAGEPNQVLFNWMLLPGWQRHKPIYRIGRIVAGSIDRDANTCSVCLDSAYSSQQHLPAVDGLTVGECGADNPVETQIADFCSRNPGHPLCTNTTAGDEIALTDHQLAQLQEVNHYVNSMYGRLTDKSGFRIGDSWDVMSPGGSGDCEDFALQKMQRLVSNYGWDPKDLVIVTSYMRDGQGHVSLGVRTSNRGLMLLDVNYDQVGEAARLPYRIDRIGLTKDTWRSYTRRLDAVPIEYMQCNAWAFAEGDSVVVQFTGQDWAQPKVVGFSDDPQPCEMNIWRHGIVGLNFSGAWKYAIFGDAWTQTSYTPPSGTTYYVNAIAFDDSANQWIFGGDNGYLECPNEGFEKNCLRFNTTAEAYVMRADHPSPARQFGQSAWYIGAGSYLIAGLLSDTCYIPDPNPEAPPTDVVNEIAVKDANAFFNDTLNAWTSKQSLPDAKCNAIDFAISGKGYVGGGENRAPVIFGGLHSYDPGTDAWSSQQGLPRDVTIGQGASLSGKGYQLLGFCSSSATGDLSGTYNGLPIWQTKWLNEYDPVADSWAAKSQGFHNGLFNGAVGINAAVWSHDLEVLQEYDPLTEAWTNHTFGSGEAPGWSHNRLAR